MATDVLWGWIPTLSGELKIPYIQQQIQKSRDTERYVLDLNEKSVNIETSDGTIVVRIRDDRGLCSLRIQECTIENERIRNIWINAVWKNFRKLLDSCSSDICNCSAMNQPVRLDGPVPNEEEMDNRTALRKIAQRFVDTMETVSDAVVYARPKIRFWKTPDLWARRMEQALTMCGLANINHLYGVRFLEIYSDIFDDDAKNDLRTIMVARHRKAETIYGGIIRRAEVEFKRLSTKLSRYMLVAVVATALIAILWNKFW